MRKSVPLLSDHVRFEEAFEIKRPAGFEYLLSLADPSFFVVIADRATGNVFKCSKLNGEDGHFILACSPLLNEQNAPAHYGLEVSDFAPHDIIAEYLFVMKANQMGMREANELIDSVTSKNKELEQARKDLLRLNELLEDRAAKTEENLRQAESELIEGEKLALLGRLAAGVAHEMNTPLGAITASADNLINNLRELFENGMMSMDCETLATAFRLSEHHASLRTLSSREERAERKRLEAHLADSYKLLTEAPHHARMLADCGVTADDHDVLEHVYAADDSDEMLKVTTAMMRARRSISTINIASLKAANVIRALKSYVRNDAGDSATVFDARRSIESVLLLFNSQMKRGVILHLDMPRELPVLGNETEVSKIWANLISNAIYAMEHRGNLWISGQTDDRAVSISFSNDGPSIPDEVKAKLFEPFFTTKPIGEGSGMGLSIISNILSSLQGSISLDSGEITTFTVTLPKALDL
jgi:two-component system, NtrC family, sensor kinase